MDLYNQLVEIQHNFKPIIINDKFSKNDDPSWMKGLFGFSDKELLNGTNDNLKRIEIVNELLTETMIYDKKTGLLRTPNNIFNAGWFVAPTVKEITDLLQRLEVSSGKPKITVVSNIDSDIVHSNSESYDIFHGESKFNGLQTSDIDGHNPYENIEDYIELNTQGAKMSLICSPGTLVRNYWVTKQYNGPPLRSSLQAVTHWKKLN